MVFQTIERWRSARNWSFGFAAAAFLVAFGVRYGLNDWLPEGLPFLTFFPAVIVTAFFAGLWPGVLVTILSTLTAWYFFLRPVHTFTLDPAEVLALVFFVAIAGISIALIEAFHVAVDRLQQERERAERLAEQRETMFAELQHRISNNLQLVAALLRLEHAQISDSRAKKALAEASRRLALIGTLHRHLYDGTGSQVDFGIFLKRLGNEVLQTWDARSVELLVQSERMILPPEQSIPIALIVAELMSNALEHGLAGRQQGSINIDLRRDQQDGIVLAVADDGKGLPPGFDATATKSLGLRIVQTLTEQLAGRFEMEAGEGTTCRIVIPVQAFAPS